MSNTIMRMVCVNIKLNMDDNTTPQVFWWGKSACYEDLIPHVTECKHTSIKSIKTTYINQSNS